MTPQLFCEYGRCAESPMPGSRFCAKHAETSRKLSKAGSRKRAHIGIGNIYIADDPRCPVCHQPFGVNLMCACDMTDEQARADYQQRYVDSRRGRGAGRTQREREG